MTEKQIICTVCPVGCRITVAGEGERIESVTGNACKRGEVYARDEFICPRRILTTSVKAAGNPDIPLVAVRTDRAVPRAKLFACMDEIRKLTVHAPIRRGDVLIQDVAGTGANVIASAELR